MEMIVPRDRLSGLRRVTPDGQIRYEKVGASRDVEGVVVAWDVPSAGSGPHSRIEHLGLGPKLVPPSDEIFEVILVVEPTAPTLLPSRQRGARIDIISLHGFRQCPPCPNLPGLSTRNVAIGRDTDETSGALWLHVNLAGGTEVMVRGPQNHFRPQASPRYVFIAAGMGIPLIKLMLEEVKRQLADYKLLHLRRSRSTRAYHTERARNHAAVTT
ncbi:hypothetical protein BJY00DRAFT_312009 [Aspergillus carlsbadensis]|nr:hypothetical protein BJY00DRAFT_312009 [Aspergillus carlsbadensis]